MYLLKDSVYAMNMESFSGIVAKTSISLTIRSVLRRAMLENRLTVGLMPAIRKLSTECNGALFCFTTGARPGDSATHMQEVLLKAFCVENHIYIVKVDSTEKLKNILGLDKRAASDCNCVLVHLPETEQELEYTQKLSAILTPTEKILINYCEQTWSAVQPIIKLPEK